MSFSTVINAYLLSAAAVAGLGAFWTWSMDPGAFRHSPRTATTVCLAVGLLWPIVAIVRTWEWLRGSNQ